MKTMHYAGIAVIAACFAGTAAAQEVVPLPAPKIRGQVMKTLKNRISVKGFSAKELSDRNLGEVLWAGFGIADPVSGRRTAPAAFGSNEIDIYVLSADGVFLYDPAAHGIRRVGSEDVRGIVASQGYVKSAPVHLIYVADYDRAAKVYPSSYDDQMKSWAMMHTGFIAQNVVLYSSSHGMSAVVRSPGNVERLRAALKLPDNCEVVMSQAVGYVPEGWR